MILDEDAYVLADELLGLDQGVRAREVVMRHARELAREDGGRNLEAADVKRGYEFFLYDLQRE